MKVGVLGWVLSYDGRGIARMTSFLFSTINKLYPDIELYLVSDVSLLKNKFADSYKLISTDPDEVKKYDLDYLICPSGFWIPKFITEYREKIPTSTKFVTFVHDIILGLESDSREIMSETPTVNNLSYLKKVQCIIDNSDIIITVSEYSKSDIIKHLDIGNKPIYVLYLSHMLFRPDISSNNVDHPILFFLYNGGYDERKGIAYILDNFLQLKLRDKLKSSLIITGSPRILNNKTTFLIEYGKDKGWVIEKGYVSDEELSILFTNALALLYPSSYEGFGLPLVDAMYLGCPVITTNVSSIPEVCADAAYYIKNRDDDDEFQKAFIELENNVKLRDDLIQKGKKNIKRFSWETSSRLFINILKENMVR